MQESWLTTYTRLAAYLGLTADGIRRIMKDEESLLHHVRCNAREAGADWRKECAKYKARLRHPAGRGCVDVRMFFRAFAPDLVDDAEELRRAVSGQPTWLKAADAGREYRVCARTLSKKTALGGFELGGLSSIRIRRTLLVRREEIASRWPRRDLLMRAGLGISRKSENPDSSGPRMGAYAAADATTSGMTMTDSALGNLRGSGAVRATDWPHRNRTGDFPRNPSRRFLCGAYDGIDAEMGKGR
ncbi:hypothetical protein [Bifidobacterium longum]|uniref:hypothetical protein n=1 Tax=Bifidobacterium longum TaxID=216816 RepID=UPI001A9733B0|nr:hypothetical protein [Bifidobacterium longum]QSY60324.1 hypothetical protein BLL421_02835 [Bifidobacterium longum subsp. longum]UHC29479.1 hypothetical protein LT344_01005 [Bifidobacterium longum]